MADDRFIEQVTAVANQVQKETQSVVSIDPIKSYQTKAVIQALAIIADAELKREQSSTNYER